MTTLANAPLVEVVTQIRWGAADLDENGRPVRFRFTDREEKELPDEFTRVLGKAGYGTLDDFAPERADVQFNVSRRYRRGPGEWPVYQTGLGVFTINQRNEEYDWASYKQDVLRGFELLTEALAGYYDSPQFIGVELGYLDVFPLKNVSPFEFLRKNFKVRPTLPPEFVNAPFLDPAMSTASLSFEVVVTEPRGVLRLSLDHEEDEDGHAYFMDTGLLSIREAIEYSRDGLDRWLEAAHGVQMHTFGTLIKPAFRKSFE